MFQSYDYHEYKGGKVLYSITDDDFVIMGGVAENIFEYYNANVAISMIVIDVYEERKLNVAANLALLFQYKHTKYDCKISDLIKWNRECNPKYLKYADAVENYMVWI
jgi:hypothetical protein